MEFSPTQMLYSRRLRDDLPTKKSLLQPKIATRVKQQLLSRQRTQAKSILTDLQRKELNSGKENQIRIKIDKSKDWIPAIVEDQYPSPRSYVVTT